MIKRFLRNAALILLIVCSVSSRTAKAEWFRFNDFSKGINTFAVKSELQPPYALDIENMEIQSKSLVQVLGSDSLQTHRIGTNPVRALYRYYDQSTGAKRLVAICGKYIYTKEDADTFKMLAQSDGKIVVTNGSARVKGLWGTNWDYLVGDGTGSNLVLIVADTEYVVSRVTTYNDLTLASNYAGGSRDSVAYKLAVTVNDTNFIDFEFWREKLFIADGDNMVRAWRHDDGFQFGYWIVDSFWVDTSYTGTCDAVTGLVVVPNNYISDAIPIATGNLYDDSNYCVVFRDTTTSYTFSTPLAIYGANGGTTVTSWCLEADTGVIGASVARHIKHDDWAYIVYPRSLSYAFSVDTVYTGMMDTSTAITNGGLGGKNVVDMIDNEQSFTATDMSRGVYAIIFNLDDPNRIAYCRTVTNGGKVKVRVVYITPFTPGVNSPYTIIRLNYYPKANYIRTNNDRLWFSGIKNQLDELWYSELLDPFRILLVNTNNPFYISRGDKPYITGLQSLADRLYIFKNRAIWGLSGYDEFDFQRRQVHSDFGATSPYSLLNYFGDAYLVSNQGLFQFDGQALTYHSSAVRSYFEDSTTTAMLDNISVGHYQDKVWVGLADTGDYNTTTLLYDFTGYSELPAYNSSSFTRLDAPGDNGDLIIGADSGRVYKYGTSDSLNGALPTPLYQSPFISFNTLDEFKRLDQIELTYSMQDSGKIEVSIFKDFETTAVFTDTIDVIRASHDRAKLECEAYGYAFSVKFRGINTRKLQISEWGANVVAYGEDENYK